MNPEDQTAQLITAWISRVIYLEARCVALESALSGFAQKRGGLPAGAMEKLLAELTAAAHQKILERVESTDPGLAALLDPRPSAPDIPDDLL